MRRDLPTGTVTFVFTDIEGSTRMLEELGADAYGELLARHHEVCRAAWSQHGGVEVDTAGDAFFVAFPTASGALGAAADAQGALADLGLRVRMGVHTGEVTVAETGYVGFEVHRAARIAAAAHGGQVVVSASTASLVPADGLLDLGDHRFKDLAAAERVYQLGGGEHPPLKSLYRSNLPVPATPFLGRERELAEVAELLRSEAVRLVTLTGPGGTGKTRLSLQAAAEASDGFPDGVFWVPLAPLDDPALVASTVARGLDVKEQPGRALVDVLCERLAGRRLLLLLDNAEHLLPELAVTVSRLSGVAGPTVIVTSRERLQLAGERTYPVPELAGADAVELFMARAADAGVLLERSAAVEELCVKLEQLPLALELAAARTVVFTPDQLLERLAQRLDLLKAGRDADPRQRTLRATIEWSYELLDEHERRLFRALSVFVGGFTYDAAEQAADADPDTLQSLLDKSLLRRRDTGHGPRYWMLETIREYAREVLDAEREEGEALDRHGRWCLAFATTVGPRLHAFAASDVFDMVDEEHANLRSALGRAAASGEGGCALRLAAALWPFWFTRGHWGEGRRLLDGALSADDGEDAADARLDALIGSAQLAIWQSDVAAASRRSEELLQFARRHKSIRAEAYALYVLGIVANVRRERDEARRLLEQALPLAGEAGDQRLLSIVLNNLGDVALQRDEFERAARLFREGLVVSEAATDAERRSKALINLAEATLGLGDSGRAEVLFREGLVAAAEIGYRDGFMIGLLGVGAVRCRSDPELACRLLACTGAAGDELGAWDDDFEGRLRRQTLETTRELLGEARYVAAYAEGRRLSLGDAVAGVLAT
jgi:predicted ATPase/class 3 adenylate cyclase/Tfp pilus assembly protein PilF